jgi:hypothetical protein
MVFPMRRWLLLCMAHGPWVCSKGLSSLSYQRILSEWKEIHTDGLALNHPFTNHTSEVSDQQLPFDCK